jgi:hypothetical protein
MAQISRCNTPSPRNGVLSLEQLEAGLRIMARSDFESRAFWDENVTAFRKTVLFAIRETSDALLASAIPLRCRVELESQLEALIQYIELANRYIACRSIDRERSVTAFSLERKRIQ